MAADQLLALLLQWHPLLRTTTGVLAMVADSRQTDLVDYIASQSHDEKQRRYAEHRRRCREAWSMDNHVVADAQLGGDD